VKLLRFLRARRAATFPGWSSAIGLHSCLHAGAQLVKPLVPIGEGQPPTRRAHAMTRSGHSPGKAERLQPHQEQQCSTNISS